MIANPFDLPEVGVYHSDVGVHYAQMRCWAPYLSRRQFEDACAGVCLLCVFLLSWQADGHDHKPIFPV